MKRINANQELKLEISVAKYLPRSG